MWIRSQDKKTLAYCTRLFVYGPYIQNLPATGIEDDYDIMGKYESEKRAKEVLDEIEKQLLKCAELQEQINDHQEIKKYLIFQMPEE
ncbi:hypothetical protein EN5CB1_16500 [Tepidimicrobium xylanilyticum]|nr:hypothetical protein EN5CB1_16500 [Tepidimicrobium xylanilyticum]